MERTEMDCADHGQLGIDDHSDSVHSHAGTVLRGAIAGGNFGSQLFSGNHCLSDALVSGVGPRESDRDFLYRGTGRGGGGVADCGMATWGALVGTRGMAVAVHPGGNSSDSAGSGGVLLFDG